MNDLKLLLHYCWQEEPFFSQLLAQIEKKADCNLRCPALISFVKNTNFLVYNPNLLFDYSISDQSVILLHELLHIINSHHLRWQNRNSSVWNVATDLSINSFLTGRMSDRLRSELLLPSRWSLPEGKTAEWYYTSLQDKDLSDIVLDHSYWHQLDFDWKSKVKEVWKNQDLPIISSKSVDDPLNWKDILIKKLRWSYSFEKEYSSKKFSRRYGRPPGKTRKKSLGKIAVILDTSSSIDASTLKKFIDEIHMLASQLGLPIILIECDHQIRRVYSYKEADFKFVRGGGSTAFSPGLLYAENLSKKESIGSVIYFTDGETSETKINPIKLPTFWIYPNRQCRQAVKWGHHLCLN